MKFQNVDLPYNPEWKTGLDNWKNAGGKLAGANTAVEVDDATQSVVNSALNSQENANIAGMANAMEFGSNLPSSSGVSSTVKRNIGIAIAVVGVLAVGFGALKHFKVI